MGARPQAWGYYQRLVKDGILTGGVAFNRFSARYGMAADLDTVSFRTLSDSTARGYEAALRVALAYSALESLEGALESPNSRGNRPKLTTVMAADVLERLRGPRMAGFRRLLISEASVRSRALDERVRRSLEEHSEGDARPVAEKLRHVVFHGALTTHGAGLATKGNQQVIADLANAVMRSVDERFADWVAAVGAEAR